MAGHRALVGVVQEEAGQPAPHCVERQILHQVREMIETVGEVVEDGEGQLGALAYQVMQVAAGDGIGDDRRDGLDGGVVSGVISEGGHGVEGLTWSQLGQDLLTPLARDAADAGLAPGDEVGGAAGLALDDDDLAGRVGAVDGYSREACQRVIRKICEQRDAAQGLSGLVHMWGIVRLSARSVKKREAGLWGLARDNGFLVNYGRWGILFYRSWRIFFKRRYRQIEGQIFIGGCSRSGTTLLGAILGAHSQCVCPPESHFKTGVLRSCRTEDGGIDLQAALRFIRIHWRFKLWGLDIDPAQAPQSSYVDLLEWMVKQYAQARGLDGRIWVDHTPENINYAPALLELFPRARIVHIVRDGRAVANSILPLDWGPNTVVRAAHWWQAMVREGLELEEQLPTDQIVRLRYEDLVREPEETARWLCGELGLAYESRMLQADGFQPPGYTASQHTLIGRRPDPQRAVRWKMALAPRQIEIFEALASELLDQLGYSLLYGSRARPPSLWESGGAAVKEFLRGDILNGVHWLVRSYPLWLSWDFVRVVSDSWGGYKKAEIEGPIRLRPGAAGRPGNNGRSEGA